jgi:hypothetical protein
VARASWLVAVLCLAALAGLGCTESPDESPAPMIVTPKVPSGSATAGTPTATPKPVVRFKTLPPGSPLPSGEECAALVRPTPENRPSNNAANHYKPATPFPAVPIDPDNEGPTDKAVIGGYAARVDGNYQGTTDEILQWGSCKWGIDEDLTRARAVAESKWRQDTHGDPSSDPEMCNPIPKKAPCAMSEGILQIHGFYHRGTYPYSSQSTAFNVDWANAWWRSCLEGDFDWFGREYRQTFANRNTGDNMQTLVTGCVGAWFTGDWYTGVGETGEDIHTYLGEVNDALMTKPWLYAGW